MGSAIAVDLLDRGERVTVVTRTGGGPQGARAVRADASDVAALTSAVGGADIIYNALNPADYGSWSTAWPPMASAILRAAERMGSVVAMVDNLYAFGPVEVAMTAALPDRPSSDKGRIRAAMWRDMLDAAETGRIGGAVAVRGSDYLGAGPSLISTMVYPRAARGRRAFVLGDPDAPHTWTNPADAAHLLVQAAIDPVAHGRYWLVPSAPAVSVRELARQASHLAGWRSPRLTRIPAPVVRGIGLASSTIRATEEMAYQFDRPFIVDADETTAYFGDQPTPLEQSLRRNLTDAGHRVVAEATFP